MRSEPRRDMQGVNYACTYRPHAIRDYANSSTVGAGAVYATARSGAAAVGGHRRPITAQRNDLAGLGARGRGTFNGSTGPERTRKSIAIACSAAAMRDN